MRRNFSQSERWMLYRMADGKCQICGLELNGVFHIDHIRPFSKGGATDVINGQVLCERCNMAKSNSYGELDEWSLPLRDWQQQAFETYLASGKPNVLVDATPGAGKTFFGLRVAHHELKSGRAQQVLIVVPSENLRSQWATEAHRFGLNLTTNYDAAFSLASDYHGVVTTYQTIAARTAHDGSFRKYTSRRNTFGILDEIHHIGESLAWANGIVSAMTPCTRRLIITGTPFRSDNNPIPFVEYRKENGSRVSVPDFQYGYGAALRDNVVRHVYFQTFDGEASWFSTDGQYVEADFDTPLSQKLAAERLRHTMNTNGDWLRKVLIDANEKLQEIRKDDPTAGGLVVTKDKAHAWSVSELLASVTGIKPTVVTSEDIDAARQIDEFRRGHSEWIVAVKMVSEGVDIRRLRVGVWATNIQTELFFRQVVGRIVRMADKPDDQSAWQYIPKLEPLTTFANSMKVERAHAIDDLGAIEDLLERERSERQEGQSSRFNGSDGRKSVLLHDGIEYAQSELDAAAEFCAARNLPVPTGPGLLPLLEALRCLVQPQASKPATNGVPKPATKTLEQQKKDLRKKGGPISRAMYELVEATNSALTYSVITWELNAAQKVLNIDSCSLEQLKERVEILTAWRKAWENGEQFSVQRYLHQRTGKLASEGAIAA